MYVTPLLCYIFSYSLNTFIRITFRQIKKKNISFEDKKNQSKQFFKYDRFRSCFPFFGRWMLPLREKHSNISNTSFCQRWQATMYPCQEMWNALGYDSYIYLHTFALTQTPPPPIPAKLISKCVTILIFQAFSSCSIQSLTYSLCRELRGIWHFSLSCWAYSLEIDYLIFNLNNWKLTLFCIYILKQRGN